MKDHDGLKKPLVAVGTVGDICEQQSPVSMSDALCGQLPP